ncbi:MAG: 3'-5' exonuclease [Lachnospiraceae bacterium]|nr:3'-5' exonuclease [Ruminococcus sp.]MCM1276321.1 3'-5' exonuclease [Lachnospiraceae bacterium]
MHCYTIDTETTGLNPDEDEILQLSIIDVNGETVYDSFFRPERHTSWESAEKVNRITPELVSGAPKIKEMLPVLNAVFANCGTIIGYNTGFDLAFLQNAGVIFRGDTRIIDVQALFMPIAGDWDWQRNNYKWQSLVECAEYCGYKWQGNAHDSLADARATLFCYDALAATHLLYKM